MATVDNKVVIATHGESVHGGRMHDTYMPNWSTHGTIGTLVKRGDVCWIELDMRRPCVVVSSDDVLDVDVWQAHVVPLTSKVERAGLAGNVLLAAEATGLPQDSVAVPLGLELIDRSLLSDRTGRVRDVLLDDIDAGVRAILNL